MPSFGIAAVLLASILSTRCCAVSASHMQHAPGFSIEQEDLLGRFEAPYGAHAVNYLNSSCGADVPFPLAARVALMCELVEKIRAECTKDKDAPVFLGRGCRGQICDLGFHRGNSTCLLEAYGETVDLHNKTLSPTCGISSHDEIYRVGNRIGIPPEGDTIVSNPKHHNCGQWLPKGVAATVRAECEEGKPEIRMELTFDREMPSDHSYTCGVVGGCPDGVYRAQILCFVDVMAVMDSHSEDASSDFLDSMVDPFLAGVTVDASKSFEIGRGLWWCLLGLGWVVWLANR